MIDLIEKLSHRVEASEKVSKAELLAALAHAHHGESVPLKAAQEQGAKIADIGRAAKDLRHRVRTNL